MNVIAKATRSGKWWAIEVPEIPGLFTQVRRLDQVEAMVQDAAMMLGYQNLSITVEASLAEADRVALEEAKESRSLLRKAEATASAATRAVVQRFRDQGFPVRDVAKLLGVTPQRISQLA